MPSYFPIESSSQVHLIAVSIFGFVLPVTAVALRLTARYVANRKIDASDYFSIAGCVGILISFSKIQVLCNGG